MCDFGSGAIQNCNKNQYVMHYATVARRNPVLASCFIESQTNLKKHCISKV